MPPPGEERIYLQEGRKEGRSVLTCIPRPKKAEKTFIRPRSSADFPAPNQRRDHQDTKSFKFPPKKKKKKPGTKKNKQNKNLETDKRVSGVDNKRKKLNFTDSMHKFLCHQVLCRRLLDNEGFFFAYKTKP
jgi:hypothetical protein